MPFVLPPPNAENKATEKVQPSNNSGRISLISRMFQFVNNHPYCAGILSLAFLLTFHGDRALHELSAVGPLLFVEHLFHNYLWSE